MLDSRFKFPPLASFKRSPRSDIEVLVVGGGIGGLFAAITCYKKGHGVRVLEAASSFASNGNGSENVLTRPTTDFSKGASSAYRGR